MVGISLQASSIRVYFEQAVNWDAYARLIAAAERPIRVLNLFGYTGGATLACAAAGASVCHVDASKGMVAWGRENAAASGLADKPVRWIVDDCAKFVAREIRRGVRYDGIIMDPPSYGRGPGGEVWKLEDSIYDFIDLCAGVLSDEPLFVAVNSYTTGLSPSVMEYMLRARVCPRWGGHTACDEIGLPVTATGGVVPVGPRRGGWHETQGCNAAGIKHVSKNRGKLLFEEEEPRGKAMDKGSETDGKHGRNAQSRQYHIQLYGRSTPRCGRPFAARKARRHVSCWGRTGAANPRWPGYFNAILLPQAGTVYVEDMSTADEDKLFDIRQKVGMVFQNPDNQIVATVVEEDVAFALENLGVPPAEMRARVDEAMQMAGIYKYREKGPHKLSGGQKQRVAIAGVIAMRPDCLVLDEATAMLDPIGREKVMRTVHRLNDDYGITVVQITHYMEEAVTADRVVVMSAGRVVMEGTPKEVFRNVEAALHWMPQAVPVPCPRLRAARWWMTSLMWKSAPRLCELLTGKAPEPHRKKAEEVSACPQS